MRSDMAFSRAGRGIRPVRNVYKTRKTNSCRQASNVRDGVANPVPHCSGHGVLDPGVALIVGVADGREVRGLALGQRRLAGVALPVQAVQQLGRTVCGGPLQVGHGPGIGVLLLRQPSRERLVTLAGKLPADHVIHLGIEPGLQVRDGREMARAKRFALAPVLLRESGQGAVVTLQIAGLDGSQLVAVTHLRRRQNKTNPTASCSDQLTL
jgi:hypothetical protein